MNLLLLNRRLFRGILVIIASVLLCFSSKGQEQANDNWVYYIQISALDDSIPVEEIQHNYKIDTIVNLVYQDGYYKYWIGPFSGFASAEKYKTKLVEKSQLKEAFIVKGENIPIKTKEEKIAQSAKDDTIAVAEESPVLLKSENPSALKSNLKEEEKKLDILLDKRILNYNSKNTLLIIVAYFFLMTFLVILFVLLSRTYNQRKFKRMDFYRKQFQTELAGYLFDDTSQIIPLSLSGVKKKRRRQILLDEIIHLKSDLLGEVSDLLSTLYQDLKLTDLSMSKLKNRRWDIKAKGMRELAVMGVTDAVPIIEKYTKSKNGILRAESFLAIVKLKKDDPLYFLDSNDILITGWDQLNIHKAIENGGLEVPDFKRWLASRNESVLVFALKMVAIYQQYSAASELLNLLTHPSEKIRNLSIKAIGELELPFADNICKIYNKETFENQLEIIRVVGLIGNESQFDFLSNIANTEPDFDKRMALVRSLWAIGPKGEKLVDALLKSKNDDYASIVAHVSDLRI